MTLEESYARCRELARRHGTTYYWSTKALPAVKRHHVWALYAFCRRADDIVDDLGPSPTAARRAALSCFGQRFFADVDRAAPTIRCSRRSCTPCAPSTSIATASAVSSGRWRWICRSPATRRWDDLLVYMDGSAAVIGEMMLPILEPRSESARPHARDLGLAFQLTNFLRDVGEDLDRGRVYLPQADLDRFGADPHMRGGR